MGAPRAKRRNERTVVHNAVTLSASVGACVILRAQEKSVDDSDSGTTAISVLFDTNGE